MAVDPDFIDEAIRRAVDRGYYPAQGQRDVDWELVEEWSRRVQEDAFRWLREDEQPKYGGGDIIVSNNGAICSGQHRILGGLMGGKPVPDESISYLPGYIPTRSWA